MPGTKSPSATLFFSPFPVVQDDSGWMDRLVRSSLQEVDAPSDPSAHNQEDAAGIGRATNWGFTPAAAHAVKTEDDFGGPAADANSLKPGPFLSQHARTGEGPFGTGAKAGPPNAGPPTSDYISKSESQPEDLPPHLAHPPVGTYLVLARRR